MDLHHPTRLASGTTPRPGLSLRSIHERFSVGKDGKAHRQFFPLEMKLPETDRIRETTRVHIPQRYFHDTLQPGAQSSISIYSYDIFSPILCKGLSLLLMLFLCKYTKLQSTLFCCSRTKQMSRLPGERVFGLGSRGLR